MGSRPTAKLALSVLGLLLAGSSCTAVASAEERLACDQATEAYRVSKISKIDNCPLGTGTEGSTRSKCPDGVQRVVNELFVSCGGLLLEGGIDWDTEIGTSVKYDVEICGCSYAARTAPTLTVLVLVSATVGLSR